MPNDFNKRPDPSKSERMKKLACELVDTYKFKNDHYGDSFHNTVTRFGPIAGIVRLWDKMERASTLVEHPDMDPGDESLKDTLKDLATYAMMLCLEVEDR